MTIIAGPCLAESFEICLQVGQSMHSLCSEMGFNYIFKASFDKANRSSIHSSRGPGIDEGLAMIQKVGQELGVPTTTDIHEPSQASVAGQAVDLLQVPAFLCRQTDLLVACAETGKAVNVKKGQFMSAAEMKNVLTKLDEAGANGVMLTERGTFFGYNRLVNDFVGLHDMLRLHPNVPVCFDVTHSTQQPGGQGTASGGRPDGAPTLAKCAAVSGVQALFMEVHPDPSQALSDAATMLTPDQAGAILRDVRSIQQALASND